MSAPTDADLVGSTTIDLIAFLLMALSGIAAAVLNLVWGYTAVELLALMVAGCATLVLNLNLRLVTILKRQRRRKRPEL